MFLDTQNPEYVALTQVFRDRVPNFVAWQFSSFGIEAVVRRSDGSLECMEESEYSFGTESRNCFKRLYTLLETAG